VNKQVEKYREEYYRKGIYSGMILIDLVDEPRFKSAVNIFGRLAVPDSLVSFYISDRHTHEKN